MTTMIGTPYRAAASTGGLLFLLYAATLAPTTAFWDASEYITAAHILGIPHPPGNPLFVLLGRAWSLLLTPLGLPPAVRVNLLAAATSAAASAFFFLVAHRIIRGIWNDGRIALWAAAAGALAGGTAFTVWNQSTVSEKVYPVSALVLAAACWLGVLWRDRREEAGSERLLLWAVFLIAIGSTNHLMSVLGLPALAVLVVMTGVGPLLRVRFLVRAGALAIIGLSVNFFLPVRAELDPVINEGDPTCESAASAALAIYSLGRTGCPLLADNLRREQYQPIPVSQRKAPFADQMENYYQYFDWQWARSAGGDVLPGGLRTPFTLLFLFLGALGLLQAWRSDPVLGASATVLAGTLTVGLVIYLNFRYGYSLAPEIENPLQHEVRERDYFYVVGFMFWGSLVGVGLSRVWTWLARRLAGDVASSGRTLAPTGPALRTTAPVLAVALLPLALNWSWASRAGDYAARDWAYDLLMSVEPYAVLFTNGDNDTFPLWYMQEVEGVRRDVTVIVGQYLYTQWYVRQLAELTSPERQRPFDPAAAQGLYEDPGPPVAPITSLEPAEMDAVRGQRLDSDFSLSLAEVNGIYPAGVELTRGDLLTLRIIQDARGERPVYFSGTGGTIARLGLGQWGVRHGLAVKLQPVAQGLAPPGWVSPGTVSNPEWIDVDRSLRLYREVYSFRGIKGRRTWPDRSVSVIWQFVYATDAMHRGVRLAGGDPALADSLAADRNWFESLARTGFAGRSDDGG